MFIGQFSSYSRNLCRCHLVQTGARWTYVLHFKKFLSFPFPENTVNMETRCLGHGGHVNTASWETCSLIKTTRLWPLQLISGFEVGLDLIKERGDGGGGKGGGWCWCEQKQVKNTNWTVVSRKRSWNRLKIYICQHETATFTHLCHEMTPRCQVTVSIKLTGFS